jgi:coenzyme F420-reducing hydrogenase delta subunit
MCTGRVDLAFVLRALAKGADGVIIGGCWPGECHYVTEGNYDALGNSYVAKKLLVQIGLSPERLRIEWIGASEGTRFAEVMSGFADTLRELGPIGQSEGLEQDDVQLRLAAVNQLVPFLKLVEREKLRIPTKREEAYRSYYESDGVNRIFENLVADKLAKSQILLLLEKSPLSVREISERLDLSPADVSRHMNDSSRMGVVRYDLEHHCYALT